MDILEIFKQSLLHERKPVSQLTLKNYLSDLRHFANWYEALTDQQLKPKDLTADLIELYKTSGGAAIRDGKIVGEKISPRSFARYLSSLRKLSTILEARQLIFTNPFISIQESEIRNQNTDMWHLQDFKDYLYVFGASHLTIKNYINDIQNFAKWYEASVLPNLSEPLTQKRNAYYINQEILEEYKKRLIDIQGAAPRTINRKLSTLRKYLEFSTKQGLLDPEEIVMSSVELEKAESEPSLSLQELKMPSAEKVGIHFSSFPPLRLLQKTMILPYLLAEEKVAFGIAALLTGKKIAQTLPLSLRQKSKINSKVANFQKKLRIYELLGIKNVKKEFYAPQAVKIAGYPLHKKLYYHIRFTRPNWYKKYSSYTFTHYFHFALLVIFAAGVGIALYQNFVTNKNLRPTFAAPVAPPRVLSFQGRLTDNLDNPITSATNVRFTIYNDVSATGAALLWQEVQYSVVPDQDGIFSVVLGTNTTIPSTVFSDNASTWLGVTIGSTAELTPRQRIASVAYATNSEQLQGMPPITAGGAGTSNVVLALDSSGNLTIGGSASPTFSATGGQFKLSGQPLLLTTNTSSNGNIQLVPDGLGKIDLQKPLVNSGTAGNIVPGGVEVNDKFGVLATESAVAAFIVNNNTTGGDIFAASSSGTTRFKLANDGTITDAVYNANGGIFYANGSGTFAQTAIGSPGQCLQSIGGGTPTWGTCGTGTSPFSELLGAIVPNNSTEDFLLGGTATTSAKFGVLNINSGTPVASISANSGSNATYLTGDGTLATTNRQTLTIGNSSTYNTTGNVLINPNGTGNVGIGTTSPADKLHVVATGNFIVSNFACGAGFAGIGFSTTLTGCSTYSVLGDSVNTYLNAPGGGSINSRVGNTNLMTLNSVGKITLSPASLGQIDNTVGAFYIDNSTTNPIVFRNTASYIERMRIDTTGNVGIGTTSPLALLHVSGGNTGGNAAVILNQTGASGNDIFTASSSGATKFTISNTGALTDAAYTNAGGILYTATTGIIGQTGIGTSSQCLIGGTTPSFGSCGTGTTGSNIFQQGSGAIFPNNSTLDFLIGGQSTASAKFAVLNINSGTPVASISANSGNIATYLTGDGTLATTNRQTLTLGNSSLYNTTGNVLINPNGTGNVGIGTFAPLSELHITRPLSSGANGKALAIFDQIENQDILTASFGGVTKFTVTNGGFASASAGFTINGVGNVQSTKNQTLTIGGSSTGDIFFRPGDVATGLYLASNGNVGIGTTNPLAQLDITKSVAGDLNMEIFNTSSGNNAAIEIRAAGTGVPYIDFSTGATSINSPDYSTRFIRNSGANGTYDFIQTGTGGFTFNANISTTGNLTGLTGLTLASGAINLGATNGTSSQCITGGATAAWGSCGSSSGNGLLRISNGAISPVNDTTDFLIGNIATTSAKFGFLNVNSGTPVASISANSGNIATYLTGDGTLATTNRQTLTIGNSSTYNTTGNVLINPNGTGNVGIGTSNPTQLLTLSGSNQDGLIITGTGSNRKGLIIDPIAGQQASFILRDGGIDKWQFGKDTANQFFVYDAVNTRNVITIKTNDDMIFNDSGGKVGIGTANPSALLDVAGAASVGGQLTFRSGTAQIQSTVNQGLTIGGNTTGNITLSPGNSVVGSNVTPGITNQVDLGTSGLQWRNVYAQNFIGGTTGIQGLWQRTLGSVAPTNITDSLNLGAIATGSALVHLAGTAGENSFINTGNVGIGTTSPSQELTVQLDSANNGVADGVGQLVLRGATNTNKRLALGFHTGSDYGWIQAGEQGVAFRNLILEPNGGVLGIGTPTPIAELHVSRPLNIGVTGKALAIFDQIENQDILTASFGGTTKFTISNTGALTDAAYTNAGGILYTSTTGLIGQTAVGSNTQCLLGGTTPSFGACTAGSFPSPFRELSGAIIPLNSTEDFLIGGQATTSAKFAVLNINSGTPTASVSSGLNGTALSFDANGTIQTAKNQTLSIGGSTTGNIALLPTNGSGNVGIGTASPLSALHILGTGPALYISNNNESISTKFFLAPGNDNYLTGTQTGDSGIAFHTSLGAFVIGRNGGSVNFKVASTGVIGIGTTAPSSELHVTRPLSFGVTGKALAIFDQIENQDILTASFGGTTKFTVSNTGALTDAAYTNAGGILYTSTTGLVGQTGVGAGTQCLLGGTTPSFGSCATGTNISPFQQGAGFIYPNNSTSDFLIGGQATTSAEFGFLNVNSGTPVASISAGTNGAIFLTANGYLSTTARQSLTLGNSTAFNTTGNILLNPNGTGNVGIGTANPTQLLALAGGNFLQTSLSPTTVKGNVNDTTNLAGPRATFVVGRYAYVASDDNGANHRITTVDINNPSTPAVIGSINSANLNGLNSIFVSGKYAYATASTSSTLAIVDITNPKAPLLISTLQDTTNLLNATSVYVNGKYAYVTASGSARLTVVDVSTPSTPVVVGSNTNLSLLRGAQSVYVSGLYAYVTAFTNSRLTVVDISNPSAPYPIGSVFDATNLDGPSSVYVSGRYAYVTARGSNRLTVIDVSDPTAPSVVGNVNDATNLNAPTSVSVASKYAYVTSSLGNRVTVVDVSTPSSPSVVGNINDATNLNNPTSIFVAGKYAYATSFGGNRLTVIDINGIDAPSATIGSLASSFANISDNLYIGNNTYIKNGLNIGNGGLMSQGTFTFDTASNGANLIQGAPIGNALLTINNTGTQDIFTASASGTSIFSITNAGGIKLGTSVGTGTQCLFGGASASWGTCSSGGGGSNWTLSTANGTLNPNNNTLDILVGSTATSSAKFSILNIAGGTPTASISATATGTGLSLGGDGTIQSFRNNTLILGGLTTGSIGFRPGGIGLGNSLFLANNGSVGIGTAASPTGILPQAMLQVFSTLGTSPVASISGKTSAPALLVTNEGVGDLFVASGAGGIAAFRIKSNGSVVVNDGQNVANSKITFATQDPLYTIGTKKYSTYVSSTLGIFEEILSRAKPQYDPAVGAYSYKLDFNHAVQDSDLWVFNRIIDPDITFVNVLVTGDNNAHVSYQKDYQNRTITLYSDRPGEISYRLSGPRFDHKNWSTQASLDDYDITGIIAPPPPPFSNGQNPAIDPYYATITINQENGQWVLKDSNYNNVNRIEAFSKAIIANIQAGFINAQKITTNSFSAASGTISNLTGNTLNFTQGAFSSITVSTSTLGNATANTFAVTTENFSIAGTSLRNYIASIVTQTLNSNSLILNSGNIISPLASIDRIHTNVISPLGNQEVAVKGNLAIKNESNETVAAIDTQGNASFGGQLKADSVQTNSASISGNLATDTLTTSDASIGGTLRANNIIATNIDGLDAKIRSIASGSGSLGNYTANSITTGNLRADYGIFEQGIVALGPSTFGSLTATDQISIGGNFVLGNNSINTIGVDLEIQSLKQGNINFMAGLVKIDTEGNMSIGGNLNVLGNIAANKAVFNGDLFANHIATNIISPLPDKDLVLQINGESFASTSGKLKVSDKNGQQVLAVNSRGDLLASGSGQFSKLNFNLVGQALATSDLTATATGSAGYATLKKDKPELTIKNYNVTANSLIYITPFGDTNNKVLYLLRQVPNTETESGSFTIGISGPVTPRDIQFNWLIVN